MAQIIAAAWEEVMLQGPVDNIFTSTAMLDLFKDSHCFVECEWVDV